ncbi:MAG: hypothetical protein JF612_12345 [Planctomycetia bacterium]|nr:hypothetical protein [Planctomycetia bacterium]
MLDLPLKITARAAQRLGQIERVLGGWDALVEPAPLPKQQWSNRVQAVFSTVAIAGGALSLEGATLVLEGKRGLLSARQVLELENTQLAYEHLAEWDPLNERHLLDAHRVLMDVLLVDAGRARKGQLRPLRSLLRFLRDEPELPAIVSAIVFHYELLRLRPFSDVCTYLSRRRFTSTKRSTLPPRQRLAGSAASTSSSSTC